jgi:two-component system phosphate regulon response regulator PhoB
VSHILGCYIVLRFVTIQHEQREQTRSDWLGSLIVAQEKGNQMSALVLIVDDEPDITATLEFNLEREGFSTRTAHNGADALEQASLVPHPDIVLLDLMLPDISGTEVCRKLRANDATKNAAIVMLTARGEVIDRVVGFEVGADDFVVKPFSVRELILRMRAILRRGTNEPESSIQETIEFGVLKLDPSSHRIWVAGEEIKLTALEFRLVRTLLERKGRVQTRETLLIDVWEYESSVTTRTVDTHVRRLRQKLGAAGDYVETIRGVGYRFLENLES